MNKTLLIVTLCLIAASVAAAQTPALTDEMKKLDFLVGEWKGHGWKLRPDGSEGNRRISIEVTDAGEWHETLEIWHLGKWVLVEESTLKKIK